MTEDEIIARVNAVAKTIHDELKKEHDDVYSSVILNLSMNLCFNSDNIKEATEHFCGVLKEMVRYRIEQ